MSKPYVIILMGSFADAKHCERIAQAARELGLETVQRVGSAHKTPEHLLRLIGDFEADPRPKVYITVAGRSNALSGFVDAAVKSPVIACPPLTDAFYEADLFSSLHMPSGVAPGVVLEPANAALLAAKILGLSDPDIQTNVISYQKHQSEKVITDDAKQKI